MNNIDPTEKTLKQEIVAHVESSTLTENQMRRLMALQNSVPHGSDEPLPPSPAPSWLPSHNQRVGSLMTLAACLVIAILTLVPSGEPTSSWHNNLSNPSKTIASQSLVKRIADEVVKNHLKLKPLDISSNSIDETQAFFKHLDFLPIHSRSAAQRSLLITDNLMGGRYCSIQGVTAAQLRYENDQGHLRTLYQVPYDADLYGELPLAIQNQAPLYLSVKGLQVRLWQEQGLLMVLVSPQNPVLQSEH